MLKPFRALISLLRNTRKTEFRRREAFAYLVAFGGLAAGPFALLMLTSLGVQAAQPEVKVYKTSTCGCCGKWVEHLRANGFTVTVTDVPSTAEYRVKYGVPEKLASCHTGVVNGYALEGHVPAREIKKMLEANPKAKGLAVPGMPAGSPGMEMGRSDAYEVLLFDTDGKTSVYGKYEAK